ncbi:hypothetical protein [Sphingomonas radiodurans]|uniref:hypothetical protein n=1 Tax=Sphingomonas radiodurans TaxID=2890321 RepID=UPI001E42B9AE|nr:hypothetical protein [Sphingomonas radiodurans]WBH16488.1 hypothetical protein LLW23_17145 [Sphingomonas radiodurans]
MTDSDAGPRKRLVIHAGLGKSGSSAIQKYCREQARELRERGIFYLGMFFERGAASEEDFGSAEALLDALAHDDGIEDRLVALLTEKIAARLAISTFVWSQIALTIHAELLGRVIARLAPICDTEVVIYFRHQATWLVSAYLQWGVKHKTEPGPILPFDQWIPHAAPRGLDYRAVIEGWRAAVGAERLHVRSYDHVDDVVSDFLTTARLGPMAATIGTTRHYETPDNTLMTLFRLYQGQHDAPAAPGGLQRALSDNRLEQKRYREVTPGLTLPHEEEWTRFAASFDITNAALAADFGLILGPVGAGPAPDPSYVAPATVVPALLDLIIAMNDRIGALERRLSQTEEE